MATRQVIGALATEGNANTRRAYAQGLADFARSLGLDTAEEGIVHLISLPPLVANATVSSYLNALAGQGLATSTRALRLAAIRAALRLARIAGAIDWQLEAVRAPRVRPLRDPRGPDADLYARILGLLSGDDLVSIRNLAIVRLMGELGLRRGEAIGLDLDDVDRDGRQLWVLGKGEDERQALTMPAPVAAAVARWLSVRPAGGVAVFVELSRNGSGGRLSGRSLHRTVARLGRQAGSGRPLHPHQLRHTAISSAVRLAGTDFGLLDLATFSRHRSPAMVQRYYDVDRDVAGRIAERVTASVEAHRATV